MKLVLIVVLLIGILGNVKSEEDETEEFCYWKADGSRECGEESEVHDIWAKDVLDSDKDVPKRKAITAEDEMLEFFKENDISLNKLELELLLNYLDVESDGSVDLKDLDAVQSLTPLQIAHRAISVFDTLDKNDDGILNKEEFPQIGDSDKEITVIDYCTILTKLDSLVSDSLSPFKGLDFLTPVEVKKIIAGSVQMFKDFDADESEGLNIDEYLNSINRPENKKAQQLGDEQKEAIFKMIDKNADGEISYVEFQSVVPQKPKNPMENLKQVFRNADLNKDGFWSEEEFSVHLKNMVNKSKGPASSEEDIAEAFEKLDEDGDGKVSEEEMKGISKEIEKIQEAKATEGFREMDIDKDGVLSKNEMETMANLMEQRVGQKVDVDTLIKMLDKNGNGVIEPDEVQALVKRMSNGF